MIDFTNQVAIITGAVGNLGHATATALQKAAARTVLVDRSSGRLRETYPALAESHDHAFAGEVDLTNPVAVAAMVERAVRRFGRVDGLVNTVGGFRGGRPVHEEDPVAGDFLFAVNARTTLNSC